MLSVLMSQYSYIESRIAPYGVIPAFFILQRGRTKSENHRGIAARELSDEKV